MLHMHISLFEVLVPIILGIYSGMVWLHHMLVLLLISRGAAMLFSTALSRFTSPPTVCERSSSPTSSSALGIFCCFYCSNSSECEVVFHCGFDFNFCPYNFESLPSLSLKGETLGRSLCDKWVLFWNITGFQVAQVLPPGLKEASSELHGT